LGSAQQPAANGDAAADTRTQDYGEDVRRTGRRTIPRLRHGEAIGIIGEVHLVPQHGLEVLLEGPGVETGGIRVLEEARGRRDRARMADTDRQVLTPDGRLQALHYARDGLQCRPVIALWRRHTLAHDEARALVHDDGLDLGAA